MWINIVYANDLYFWSKILMHMLEHDPSGRTIGNTVFSLLDRVREVYILYFCCHLCSIWEIYLHIPEIVSPIESLPSVIFLGTTQNFKFSFTFTNNGQQDKWRVNLSNGDTDRNKDVNLSPLCPKLKINKLPF